VVGRKVGVYTDQDGDTWLFDGATGDWTVHHGAADAG